MATVYRIKKVPVEIQRWGERFMPEDALLKPYWYYGRENRKVYGCVVMQNGNMIHNATQCTLEEFQVLADLPF